jgi:hypothetical protein
VAVKVAEVAAAAAATEVGMERVALVLVSATAAPPAGAALVNVTAHVLEALGPRLVGLHAREEISTGATRLTVALAELLL